MNYLMTDEEIKNLQKHALYVLCVFDEFCTKHQLRYTLSYGTLLGAVRHKGFIPWDDDIDVSMLRPDYERFLALAGKSLTQDVLVQTYVNEPEYIHAFTRLVLDGSIAEQEKWAELDFNKGVFIDVFPLDKLAPKNKRKQHEKRINRLRRAKIAKLKIVERDGFFKGLLDKFKRIILKPFSMHYLNNQINTEVQRYNHTDTYIVNALTEGVLGYYEQYKFDAREMYKLQPIEFESHKFWAHVNYDKILTSQYGEYLTKPPKDERVPHHGFVRFKFRDDILEKEI